MLFTWAYNRSTSFWTAWLWWMAMAFFMSILLGLSDRLWVAAYTAGHEVMPRREALYAMLADAPWGASCEDIHPCEGYHCPVEGSDIFPRTMCVPTLQNHTKCLLIGRYLSKIHHTNEETQKWNFRVRLFDLCITMNLAFFATTYYLPFMVKDLTGCGPNSWIFRIAVLMAVYGWVGDFMENVPLLYASLYPPPDTLHHVVCVGYWGKYGGYMLPGFWWPTYGFWRLVCCGPPERSSDKDE
mmetsp:Transcript_24032/g.55985  ORF Transcript_24032/g.55985 Transcript_24032/m.55985 type:complete len:241 (-) Transcript_24032:143-865(-)